MGKRCLSFSSKKALSQPLQRWKSKQMRTLSLSSADGQGRPADVPVPVRLGDTRHLVDAVESDRDCKVCSSRAGAGRKRTIYVCTNCPDEPHLCAKSCFLKYHTQPDYKIE